VTGPRNWAPLVASLPIAIALLAPVLPLLILLADVLPPGLPIEGGRTYALVLAALLPVITLAAVVALVARRGVAALRQPPVMAPIGCFIVIQVLAATSGLARLSSLLEIACQIVAALVYAVAYWTLADDRTRNIFLGCFFGSGIAASAFAIALTLTRHPPAAFAFLHGRAAGTFLQPNEFGGYLLFLIPLGIAQLAAPKWLARLGFFAAAVGAIGLALSVSRAAWLGLAVGLPFLLARIDRRVLLGYAVAATLAIVIGAFTIGNLAHDPSENASRIAVWQGAARLVERFAFTGIGPAAFSKVYPSYKLPSALVDEVHAHDLPLNVLVEDGVFGFAAFTWIVGSFVAAALRVPAAIGQEHRDRALLFAGLAAAFVASAVQNAIDDVTTFVLILWWPMMGLMLSLAPLDQAAARRSSFDDRRKRPPARRAQIVTLLAMLVLAGCGRPATQTTAPPTVGASPAPSAPNISSITAHGQAGRPITIENIENAAPVYRLSAASVTYLPDRSQGTFSDVKVVFYKGRTVRLTVTAPSAALNLKSYDVILRGGVRAVNAAGDTLRADQISYDGKAHVLRAGGDVVAVDATGTRITGDSAIADLDLQVVKIFGHIGMTGASRP